MKVGPDWLILALVLAVLVGWPVLATVIEATDLLPHQVCAGDEPLGPELDSGRGSAMASPGSALSSPVGPMLGTIQLVLASMAIALPLGVPLAFLLFRTDVWGRKALLGLVLLVLFLPTPLHATAWLGSFGNAGRLQALGSTPILVGLQGAAFVHAMASLPWVVLLSGVGLRAVEPELEESALLDLPAWQVAFQITLRRAVGAVAGAALAVAVLTAGDMTVTDLLQVRTYAEETYLQIQTNGFAAAARESVTPIPRWCGAGADRGRRVVAARPGPVGLGRCPAPDLAVGEGSHPARLARLGHGRQHAGRYPFTAWSGGRDGSAVPPAGRTGRSLDCG